MTRRPDRAQDDAAAPADTQPAAEPAPDDLQSHDTPSEAVPDESAVATDSAAESGATGSDHIQAQSEPVADDETPAQIPAAEAATTQDEPDTPTPAKPQPSAPSGEQTQRRAPGSLRAAILDILRAHPDRQYKTSELCKLITAAQAGTGVPAAGAGAVFNAVIKLVNDWLAVQTVDRPATFQLAAG